MSAFALLLQDGAQRSAVETGWRVYGGYVFADPYFLVLLAIVPVATILGRDRRRYAQVRVPFLAAGTPRSKRQKLSRIIPLVECLALLLAVVALARPLRGTERFVSTTEGVDIALLLDRSSSMMQRAARDQPRRFDVAKRVLGEFAERRMTDEEGAADSVALFGFAKYTELLCPFTLDADSLLGVLDELEIETVKNLDGTGIGVALAASVDILKSSEAKSRVIVLLTDGEETIDLVPPLQAAAAAAEEGIRIYTIFSGPKTVMRLSLDRGGRRAVRVNVGQLPDIAEVTGGRFFHAVDESELEDTYAAIEELERSERSSERFAEHYDLYPAWLRAALILYGLAFLSRHTWARRIA
ncbi:MAG: Ca-activated chloride channel family protein [Planctomycetota bacterium]|jgi:Ca-activated chloride channel family protein